MSLNGQQLLQGLSERGPSVYTPRTRGVYTHGHSGYKHACRCGVCRAGNRAAHSKRVAATRSVLREIKAVPCADCGVEYPYYVMDFDHRPGTEKAYNVGLIAAHGRARIAAEVSKCDVVCANCHRERTFARNEVIECR